MQVARQLRPAISIAWTPRSCLRPLHLVHRWRRIILTGEISIQRDKCEPVHIDLQQNGLVIDIQRSSIMWTRYEVISFGFVAAVSLTGVGLLSTLLF
jgi:hypothetical protein